MLSAIICLVSVGLLLGLGWLREYLYNGRGRWKGVPTPDNCTCIHGVDRRAIYLCRQCEVLRKADLSVQNMRRGAAKGRYVRSWYDWKKDRG